MLEVAVPEVGLDFHMDDVVGKLYLRHTRMADPPPRQSTIVELDKRTLQMHEYPRHRWDWDGKERVERPSPVGQVSFEDVPDGLVLVLNAGVCKNLGLDATPVEGGMYEMVLAHIPEGSEENPEDTIHEIVLFRGERPDGKPSLTLGTLCTNSVRLYPLHDPETIEVISFLPQHKAYLSQQIEDTMVRLCSFEMVLDSPYVGYLHLRRGTRLRLRHPHDVDLRPRIARALVPARPQKG